MRIRTGISTDRNGTAGAGQCRIQNGRPAGTRRARAKTASLRGAGQGAGKTGGVIKGGKAGDDGLEFTQEMADGLGTGLAIALLAGLMLPFTGAPSAVYGLPDVHRLPLSACFREGGESGA